MEQSYHFGIPIREYRVKKHISQRELANSWPRSDGGVGCSQQYLNMVERGERLITDQQTLRNVAALLDIPLWRFGLSNFDPFNPESGSSVEPPRVLEYAEYWIARAQTIYRTLPLPYTAADVAQLQQMFEYFKETCPPSPRLLTLYAQVQHLTGSVHLGLGEYKSALGAFQQEYQTATELEEMSKDATMICYALVSIGIEINRRGYLESTPQDYKVAVECLEKARDISFECAREVQHFVLSYLARCYALAGDENRFKRAIETAERLGNDSRGHTPGLIHQPMSGIMAERSGGLVFLHKPQEVLQLRATIEVQAEKDNNKRLLAWLPLDWARAFLQQGEIEAAVKEGREFHRRAVELGSPHAISRASRLVKEMEAAGYGDVATVRELKDDLYR